MDAVSGRARSGTAAAQPSPNDGCAVRTLNPELNPGWLPAHWVIAATSAALERVQPRSVQDVRCAPALVEFSDGMRAQSQQLQRFLFQNLYRHPQVVELTGRAQQVVRDLFAAYLAQPQEMKPGFAARAQQAPHAAQAARAVADFIAGMTDRYAAREHERLTGQRLLG